MYLLWVLLLAGPAAIGVYCWGALAEHKSENRRTRLNKMMTLLAATLTITPFILMAYVMMAHWVKTSTDNDIKSENINSVKETYGIDRIKITGDPNTSVSSAINDTPGQDAKAIQLTTDDGRSYDQARLVYHEISSDNATHAVTIEVINESAQEWEEWVELDN